MMPRLSIVVIALGLLIAASCSGHQEMTSLYQQCHGGDKSACAQLSALDPTWPGGSTGLPPGGFR